MTDWSDGYMTEVEYSHGYFSHLNPTRMAFMLLSAGLTPPKIRVACELGFGQGVTINIHAAASTNSWHGNDFHPAHCAFANSLAYASGAPLSLSNESFAEYCARTDLPDFDFIALHGIWSWISEANRSVIVDFVQRKLKPGGVLSISYNTLQHWSAMSPLRELLLEHTRRMSAVGRSALDRINAAFDFAHRLTRCLDENDSNRKTLLKQLNEMQDKDRRYVAGEYFGDEWHPMSFPRVSRRLSAAKVSYACSAKPMQHVRSATLTAAQYTLVSDINDVGFRETVFDQIVKQRFRCEYWGKGLLPLSTHQREVALRAQRVVLVDMESSGFRASAKLADGGVLFSDDLLARVVAVLGDRQPHTLGGIERLMKPYDIDLDRLMPVILWLMNCGYLFPAQDDNAIAATTATTMKLNRALMEQTALGVGIQVLSSPVTGGGIDVKRYHQLFLLARHDGATNPSDWAESALCRLEANGEAVSSPSAALSEPAANLVELVALAKDRGTGNPAAWAEATLEFLLDNDQRIIKAAPLLSSRQKQLDELVSQAHAFEQQVLPALLALGIAQ